MQYYEKIDGLRFVAIFLVLLEHFASPIGKPISSGYYGVDLFFVISGFLITGILIRKSEDSFGKKYGRFIARRTLRIFPVYYITIGMLWLLNMGAIRNYFFWFVTYTFNYAKIWFHIEPYAVNHFWSLCVEEQFYIFWPFIVLSLSRYTNWLVLIIIAIIVAGYSQLIFNVWPSLAPYNETGLLTRMSSIAMGALGAVLFSNGSIPAKFLENMLLEYGIFLLFIANLVFPNPFTVIIAGTCFLYIVLKAAGNKFNSGIINRLLADKRVIKIGMLSYGIYLFHIPLSCYVSEHFFDPIWNSIDFSKLGQLYKLKWNSWIIKFPLYSLLSIAMAAVSYRFIERPVLQWKDKVFRY